jgi:hypothetical protein
MIRNGSAAFHGGEDSDGVQKHAPLHNTADAAVEGGATRDEEARLLKLTHLRRLAGLPHSHFSNSTTYRSNIKTPTLTVRLKGNVATKHRV